MNNQRTNKRMRILLIEDNAGDVRLTQEIFRENKFTNNIDVVSNGIEALAFLRQVGQYKNALHPDLILLDLSLPKGGGMDVLIEIKADDVLKLIPVVILTASQATQDIVRGYNFHANAYVIKPVNLEQYIDVIKSIEGFWVGVVKLPPHEKE
jgi:chemotaxis family two-component system response regulator Rcp1